MTVMADDGDALPPPSSGDAAWEGLRKLFAGLDMGPLPTATELHPLPAPALDTTYWRARRDSNSRPLAPEANALSN